MSSNPNLDNTETSLRRSITAFSDSAFQHIKNIRTTTADHSTLNRDQVFGVHAAIQKAQAGQMAAEVAQEKAELANKAKSDFLADMSHEIRTPISAIIGLTNILLSSKLDNDQRKCLSVLQGSAEGLMVMLKSLLNISKIESGIIDLEQASFSMMDLLEQSIAIMSANAQEKGIALTLDYDAALPQTFIGDGASIRQIVLNLVGNAIKFTGSGGVKVSFSTGEKRNGKRQVFISVTDTGIGISEDKLNIIFDRFVQANSAIAYKYGGTGLGLSISKTLARNMGGDITVSSIMGKGSTFTLCLHLPDATTAIKMGTRPHVIDTDEPATVQNDFAW